MTITITEKVNHLKANYLLDHLTFDEYYKTYMGTKKDAKIQYKIVLEYLEGKCQDVSTISEYGFTKNRKDGRLYGREGKTLQSCSRNIRGFLCKDISTDIDIKNAHPVILNQLCKDNEILCPYLNKYCNERDECLSIVMRDLNMTREEAKRKILISTNENRYLNTKCEFLKNYDKEMKLIQKKFLEINDFNYIKDYAKKDSNFEGSFINHILCIHENQILTQMRNFCDINEIKIQALMFDGMMVYDEISRDTINKMEKYIHKYTEFEKLELTIKEHETTFTLPSSYKPKPRIEYEDVKRQFELQNCKVDKHFYRDIHGIKTCYSKAEFSILHEELKYYDPIKKIVSFFMPEWFADADKKKYDRAESYPNQKDKTLCPEWCYNLWNNYVVENMEKQEDTENNKRALEMFLNHIEVMCDYNKEHYKFVLWWICQMFQYPENKSIELIFISEEGAGKGTLLKFLTTMMGYQKVWECTDPEKDVFGSYNDGMINSMLVVFNEADKSNFFNSNNKKKALITEPTIDINSKYGPKFKMNSYHRFMIFSNNVDPNNKLKRRDFTIRMSDDKIYDKEYWNEINKYSGDINCCKYIYDYLMKQEVKDKINRWDIPKGDYDDLLVSTQVHHIWEFFEEYVWRERDACIDKKKAGVLKPYSICVTNKMLYEDYKQYCFHNHINHKLEPNGFAMRIYGKNFKSISNKKVWLNGKSQNTFNITYPDIYNDLKMDIDKDNDIRKDGAFTNEKKE